jgi:hypothetical protein
LRMSIQELVQVLALVLMMLMMPKRSMQWWFLFVYANSIPLVARTGILRIESEELMCVFSSS